MSARDSSDPAGPGNSGAGGLGNGGLGGGMGGGNAGGGWGGGMSGNTGMGTGNTIYGTTAFGRPGGMAMGYGMNAQQAYNNAMAQQHPANAILSHPAVQGIVSRVLGRPATPSMMPPVSMPSYIPGALYNVFGTKPYQEQAPTYDPSFRGNTFDPTTGQVGYGKYQDHVPGYSQNGSGGYGR